MKLKHLFYAAAVSTLAAACSEADELSSGIQIGRASCRERV